MYIPLTVYTHKGMKLVKIYECLCDETRLRILNLLGDGALCVCDIQGVLGEPQVKVSKHLAYLRARGMVTVRREANWMIYSLPERRPSELERTLACLQDCSREDPVFQADREKLGRLTAAPKKGASCCTPTPKRGRRAAPAS